MEADHCPYCRAPSGKDARYCSQCGQALDKTIAQRNAELGSPGLKLQSERRQITVMFCDLVGSTQLSSQLDPEDYTDLLVHYRDICIGVIEDWGGYLANYLGDGLLVYFGWPRAHEDDAKRAIYAAQDIIEQIRLLDWQPANAELDLAVRIGISTGLVIIGSIGMGTNIEHKGVVGEAPNIAAKLQAVAPINSVVVNELTRQITGDKFRYRALKNAPVPGYRVLAENAPPDRSHDWLAQQQAPVYGRETEMTVLRELWEKACQGRIKSVLIQGEAGIGKSHLLTGLRRWLADTPHTLVMFRCSAYHSQSAFYPIFDFLNYELAHKSSERLQSRIRVLLQKLNMSPGRSGNGQDQKRLRRMPTLAAKDNQKAYITQWTEHVLYALSRRQPLLAVMEDMHWIDPSSYEILQHLIERLSTQPILVVATSRNPETFHHPDHLTLPLQPLETSASEALVTHTAQHRNLPASSIKRIATISDGNPLYAVELTRTFLDKVDQADAAHPDNPETAEIDLPASLQDLLISRVQSDPETREIVALAAAIGRHFDTTTLAEVAERKESNLSQALARLATTGIIEPVDSAAVGQFRFCHALLRESAYLTLLLRDRERIHKRIADVLRSSNPAIHETDPERLAYHLSEAGAFDQAADAWLAAGKRAIRLGADIEAEHHFRQSLRMLDQLPVSPETDRQRVDTLIELGAPSIAVHSWAANIVKQQYQRATKLSRTLKLDTHYFTSIHGLWGNALLRGEVDHAMRHAEKLLDLAKYQDRQALDIEALLAVGMAAFWAGQYKKSLEFVNEVNLICAMEDHASRAYTFGMDPRVAALFYISRVYGYLGDTERAKQSMRESIDLAERLQHDPSLVWGLGFYAHSLCMLGDYDAALVQADRAISLCRRKSLPLWQAWGEATGGYARARMGDTAGISQIQRGIDLYSRCEAKVALPYFYGFLSEAMRQNDDLDAALTAAKTGLDFATRLNIRAGLPSLLLSQALCLHAQGDAQQQKARTAIDRAEVVAREQSALTSLVRIQLGQHTLAKTACDKAACLIALKTTLSDIPDARSAEIDRAYALLAEASDTSEHAGTASSRLHVKATPADKEEINAPTT